MTYHGWANWETWRVVLQVDNDPELRGALDRVGRTATGVVAVAAVLRDWFEDRAAREQPADLLTRDLLWATLSEVNWFQIAADRFGAD